MLRQVFILAATAAILVLSSHPATSAIETVSGSFTVAGLDVGLVAGGELSGSFSFLVDDSILTGVSEEGLLPQPGSLSFTFTPSTFAGVTWDTTNTNALAVYLDGVFGGVLIGGILDGLITDVTPGTADFALLFIAPGAPDGGPVPLRDVQIADADDNSTGGQIGDGLTGFGTAMISDTTAIPGPLAAITLPALLGLMAARRRQQ